MQLGSVEHKTGTYDVFSRLGVIDRDRGAINSHYAVHRAVCHESVITILVCVPIHARARGHACSVLLHDDARDNVLERPVESLQLFKQMLTMAFVHSFTFSIVIVLV